VRGFARLADPYGGGEVVVVPALPPDVAILHVQEADAAGNARIWGTRFEDVLMAQAARRVIVTAERIVDWAAFEAAPESVAIAGFLVDAVVEAPGGAWPCGCAGLYEPDGEYLAAYVAASREEGGFRRFVGERVVAAASPSAPPARGSATPTPPSAPPASQSWGENGAAAAAAPAGGGAS